MNGPNDFSNRPSVAGKRISMQSRCLRILLVAFLLPILIPIETAVSQQSQSSPSEDIVVVRRKDSDATYQRRGTIEQWQGQTLTLSVSGRSREIELEEIVEVQTRWPAAYVEAKKQMQAGDLALAAKQLQSAFAAETRDWARRVIQADLVRVLEAIGNHGEATRLFVDLLEADRQSRFFRFCPLPWTAGTGKLDRQAETLMKSNDPVQQLLGASWLLSGRQREQAEKILEVLTRDTDPQVKSLAIAQLWRVRMFGANAKQAELWQRMVDQMPAPIKAGPLFVLAETQARLGQLEEAKINLMRIPILYPEHLQLSAAALYRAGQLFQQGGQATDARTVWSELFRKFPTTVWGQQVASQFPTSEPNQ
jgi:tetratricopeptide (TPR) repeat protein